MGDTYDTENPVGRGHMDAAEDNPAAQKAEELQAPLTRIEPVVREVAAELTEAPTNWHQMVIFFILSTDEQDVSEHHCHTHTHRAKI